ncbi:hypothetical protein [Bradyrhizobium sp. MOS002]|nr:hypothetical protein [Bradyrhizobium sp. MOS002]
MSDYRQIVSAALVVAAAGAALIGGQMWLDQKASQERGRAAIEVAALVR